MEAGNVTPGFMNYVLLLGLANGQAPTGIGLRFPRSTVSIPYMAWALDQGGAP